MLPCAGGMAMVRQLLLRQGQQRCSGVRSGNAAAVRAVRARGLPSAALLRCIWLQAIRWCASRQSEQPRLPALQEAAVEDTLMQLPQVRFREV